MTKSVFLRDFLQSARNVRNSGGATPERSFYAALSVLLNGIGETLKPKVTVVMAASFFYSSEVTIKQ